MEKQEQKPVRVVVFGALGRMGKLLSRQLERDPRFDLVGRIDEHNEIDGIDPMVHDIYISIPEFDVQIDFATPDATRYNVATMRERKAAWLVATTGIDDDVREEIESLSVQQPIMIAANTSLGIAVMQRLCAQAAAILGSWDCEIVETHHRGKVDAPSGTALALAKTIASARSALGHKTELVTERASRRGIRPDDEIGISSLRGGSVAGEHTAVWFGAAEQFEIHHTAESREIFANGARNIALWLARQKPGLYNIQQYLDELLG